MAEPQRYQRKPGVSETELDGEIFLVQPDDGEVFYLDAMGAGLWRLIAVPQSFDEAVTVFRNAFPDIDSERVESDLKSALQILLDRGLVEEVS